MRPEERPHDVAVAARVRQIAGRLPQSDAMFIVSIVEMYQQRLQLSEDGQTEAMEGWRRSLDGWTESSDKRLDMALKNLRRAQLNAAVWSAVLFVSILVAVVRL